MSEETYDWIVVGAGSAGCVLADRLSESGDARVLTLEAGGSDAHPWVQLPIGYGKAFFDPLVNWRYLTEPVAALNGRRSYWPRGKVMGGSSAINAMVWARGHPSDFEDWAQEAPGWSWADVAPHFRAIERYSEGGDGHRGDAGRQAVASIVRHIHPLTRRYLDAACQAGFGYTPDYNGAAGEGGCVYQITVENGRRASAARSFLRPALGRSNLELALWSRARRIVFEGKRAIGVRYRRFGKERFARARREVILAAGAIGSPQLLEVSGVGPPELLRRLEIDVVHPSPAVGRHLQDHVGVDLLYRAKEPTLNQVLRPLSGRVRIGLQYLLTRKGPLSMSLNQAGGFVRSDPALPRPDLQLYFQPMSYSRAPAGKRPLLTPDAFFGFTLGYNGARPTSRGHLEIESPDPADPPAIHPNYFATREDLDTALAGARVVRAIASQPALASVIDSELAPGPSARDDADIEAHLRANAWTVFHPCCTCKMGKDPRSSVLDPRLRVHGLDGLRVIDASAFPFVTSANTNAPTIMLAHRAAEMTLADWRA